MGEIMKKAVCYKGSYTVEAALISGVLILTVCFVLFLFLGIEKRNYYSILGLEAVVSGSTKAVRSTGNGVETAAKIVNDSTGEFSVSGSKREISVYFESSVKSYFGNLQWGIKESCKAKVIRPVLFIEKVKKIEKLRE